ncbi:rna polymerase i [Lichtheimia corymbifera JMRC:FSU:9682]|uniref:Rna polymerase i n=2 Tax=Lichtheimia TaxID=688353 RepID=A0A068RZB0_9FUNG|nr:uncharacterized protein O0I10_008990 [Lichtheimia ornata]KAJ8655301.1 hypothetical protein O0I10_008990 [Lichtheimia ornata]CDH55040.1 rna polymerase i [Lichtheimia corymbifera JMRC:FSU:9682]
MQQSSNKNILLSDLFRIKDIDPNGKRFDRVSRLVGKSETYEMTVLLDYNSEIYPLEINEKVSIVLASSLSLEAKSEAGNADGNEARESWRERAPGEHDLSDEYEYVMFGKVYRYEDSNPGVDEVGKSVAVYISFGGLLMCLDGDCRHLEPLTVGEHVYLLMRK